MDKEKRIQAEDRRLRQLYKDLPDDVLAIYDGLIKRSAYMKVTLEDYEADIDAKGYVEEFTQSDKTAPYERERPVARLYNTMNKNYQSIIKQLAEALPDSASKEDLSEIKEFLRGGKK